MMYAMADSYKYHKGGSDMSSAPLLPRYAPPSTMAKQETLHPTTDAYWTRRRSFGIGGAGNIRMLLSFSLSLVLSCSVRLSLPLLQDANLSSSP